MVTQSGVMNTIGKYLSSLLKKAGKSAGEDPAGPKAKPKGEGEAEPEPQPEPEVEPEPEGPPQVAPEGAPDTSLNVPRARDLAETSAEGPRPGIATMGRPDDGNLNLRALGDDEDLKEISLLLQESQDMYRDRKSRKRVTLKDTIEKSEDIRVLQDAINKPWDASWSHEEIMALGQLNKSVTVKMKDAADILAAKLVRGEITKAEEIAFAYIENQAIMVQQKMTDAAAASGRSLQAFKKIQDATNSMEYQKATRELVELQGGSEALRERIKMYAEGKTLQDIYRAKMQGGWEKAKAVIMQVRYNMMLSSIRTHVANISGSGFYTAYENLWVRPLMVGFNKLEQGARAITPGVGPMKAQDAMVWREAWAMDHAAMQGAKDGFAKGWRTFLGKEKDVGPTKLSVEGPGRRTPIHTPKSTIGKIATGATRALEAEDVAFRVINSRMELSRLAHREATHTAGNADEAAAIYKSIMENPPEHIRKQAQDFGERAVFIQDPNIDSRLLGGIANMVASGQQKNLAIQLVVPFVKTPANLMIYAKNNLGISSRMVTDYLSTTPIKRAEYNARLTSALGLYFLTRDMYDSGELTGVGNPNKAIRAAERQMNANPSNSIRSAEGEWKQLNRMDPAGLALGMMATLHEQIDYYEGDNKATVDGVVNTVLEVSQLMLDRSMLSGISETMSVMQGTAGAAKKGDVVGVFAVIPSLVTPGILRDVRMATDPSMRAMDPEGSTAKGLGQRIWKRWQNSMPGLSENLPPKRDWSGQVKDYQGNWFYRAVVPITKYKPKNDPSSTAIIQYGVNISPVRPKFIIPGTGVPLNTMEIDGGQGWAHNKLQEFVGKERKILLDKHTSSSAYKKRTEENIQDGVVMDQFKYETEADIISSLLSAGRSVGIQKFLKWIDGRTTIPGPKGKEITLEKVVNKADYTDFAKQYRKGKPVESDLYEIPNRAISPGAQQTINESVEF